MYCKIKDKYILHYSQNKIYNVSINKMHYPLAFKKLKNGTIYSYV